MINLTPHTITVRPLEGPDFIYPPSGYVARINMITTVVESPQFEGDVPVITATYGEAALDLSIIPLNVDGTPEGCLVSTMFADAFVAQHGAKNILALYVPDSGPSAIRENGQIVAVRQLIRKTGV